MAGSVDALSYESPPSSRAGHQDSMSGESRSTSAKIGHQYSISSESPSTLSSMRHHPAMKLKRLQSASYDESSRKWKCKHCHYLYPNPNPGHRQRRLHKKICPGQDSGDLDESLEHALEVDSSVEMKEADVVRVDEEKSGYGNLQNKLGLQESEKAELKSRNFEAENELPVKLEKQEENEREGQHGNLDESVEAPTEAEKLDYEVKDDVTSPHEKDFHEVDFQVKSGTAGTDSEGNLEESKDEESKDASGESKSCDFEVGSEKSERLDEADFYETLDLHGEHESAEKNRKSEGVEDTKVWDEKTEPQDNEVNYTEHAPETAAQDDQSKVEASEPDEDTLSRSDIGDCLNNASYLMEGGKGSAAHVDHLEVGTSEQEDTQSRSAIGDEEVKGSAALVDHSEVGTSEQEDTQSSSDTGDEEGKRFAAHKDHSVVGTSEQEDSQSSSDIIGEVEGKESGALVDHSEGGTSEQKNTQSRSAIGDGLRNNADSMEDSDITAAQIDHSEGAASDLDGYTLVKSDVGYILGCNFDPMEEAGENAELVDHSEVRVAHPEDEVKSRNFGVLSTNPDSMDECVETGRPADHLKKRMQGFPGNLQNAGYGHSIHARGNDDTEHHRSQEGTKHRGDHDHNVHLGFHDHRLHHEVHRHHPILDQAVEAPRTGHPVNVAHLIFRYDSGQHGTDDEIKPGYMLLSDDKPFFEKSREAYDPDSPTIKSTDYDFPRVLRDQTTHELVCPVCGARITRRIIVRKKRRTFVSKERAMLPKASEITEILGAQVKTPDHDRNLKLLEPQDARKANESLWRESCLTYLCPPFTY